MRSSETFVFLVGAVYDFYVSTGVREAKDLASKYRAIRLSGAVKDIYGGDVWVADEISDLKMWWNRASTAHVAFKRAIMERQIKVLETTAKNTQTISGSYGRS